MDVTLLRIMYVHHNPDGQHTSSSQYVLAVFVQVCPTSFRIFRITYTGDLYLSRKGTIIEWYAFEKIIPLICGVYYGFKKSLKLLWMDY